MYYLIVGSITFVLFFSFVRKNDEHEGKRRKVKFRYLVLLLLLKYFSFYSTQTLVFPSLERTPFIFPYYFKSGQSWDADDWSVCITSNKFDRYGGDCLKYFSIKGTTVLFVPFNGLYWDQGRMIEEGDKFCLLSLPSALSGKEVSQRNYGKMSLQKSVAKEHSFYSSWALFWRSRVWWARFFIKSDETIYILENEKVVE